MCVGPDRMAREIKLLAYNSDTFWGILWCPGTPLSEYERGGSRSLVRSWRAMFSILLIKWQGNQYTPQLSTGDCREKSDEDCSSAKDLHVKSCGVTGHGGFSLIQEIRRAAVRLVAQQTSFLRPHLTCDVPTRNDN